MTNNSDKKYGAVESFLRFTADMRVVFFGLLSVGVILLVSSKIEERIPGGAGLINLQLAFTKSGFENVMKIWGDAGIGVYKEFLWIDYLHSFLMAFLISSAIAYFRVKGDPALPLSRADIAFFIIPFAGAAFDFAENFMHLYLLSAEHISGGAVLLSSLISSLKLLALFGGIMWLFRNYVKYRKVIAASR